MEKLKNWIQMVEERRIDREFDLMCPIVADEGYGKSTLILTLAGLWHQQIGKAVDPEAIFDRIAWSSRDEFKHLAVDSDPRDVIAAPDAARILYKRDAMDPDQRELEKDLLDIRTHEYLFLLGFQSWDIIPSMLQDRRAKQLLYIPRRGVVHGYNRSSLNQKCRLDPDEWPDPDMTANFPPLDGKKIWKEYQKLDKQKKRERIAPEEENEEPEVDLRTVADEIIAEGLGAVVSIHGGNKNPYINKELIELDYGLSARQAGKVKALLERRVDSLEQYVEQSR